MARYEMQLQAYGPAAGLNAFQADVASALNGNKVDIDQGSDIVNRQQTDHTTGEPYLMVSMAGTSRAGIDKVAGILRTGLAQRGLSARAPSWVKQVDDQGVVVDTVDLTV